MKQLLILTSMCMALLNSGCNFVVPTPPVETKPPLSVGNNPHQALVIGNKNYEYAPLVNTVNDAQDMATALTNKGFVVTYKTDLDFQGMMNAIAEFNTHLSRQQGEVVSLFYFAGHGASVEGQNYLLPVDNNRIRTEADLKDYAIPAKMVLAELENVNNGRNIMVLDACRNNPYKGSEASIKRGLLKPGLVKMQPPQGSLVAFATGEGSTASDSDVSGRNGLYTRYLVETLNHAEHVRIEDVFMQVRNFVTQESDGKQEPWYRSSLRKPFCFGGCQP